MRAALSILLILAVAALAADGVALAAAREAAGNGLVPLPCEDRGPLRPHSRAYCAGQRHYVRPAAREALLAAAQKLAARRPGAVVRYMEASWPRATRPMPPHFSHGDGRQIDLAVFYRRPDGTPLPAAPTLSGYGAYEPPAREAERVCVGVRSEHARPDPPASRRWRLDEARTAELIGLLAPDGRVRRIFVEPHLKRRLGFAQNRKVRFAGCRAARHDDHLHVDFL